MKDVEIICIGCPRGCRIRIESSRGEILSLEGYECQQGRDYAREEFRNPTRILPTTIRVRGGELPLVPVKTDRPVARDLIRPIMRHLTGVEVRAPIRLGQVLVEDVLGSGASIVATRTVRPSSKSAEAPAENSGCGCSA